MTETIAAVAGGGWRHGVSLAECTTLRLGGPAGHYFEADSEQTLIAALRDARGHGEDVLVLGGGSNLVVADEGFPGSVIKVGLKGISLRDGLLSVAAGEVWDEVVARSVAEGLAGIECLSGIPGLAGATPIQNVGAYGQSVDQAVVLVDAYDRVADGMAVLDNGDCAFSYRHSAFKGSDRYVVTAVHFQLEDLGGLSKPVGFKDVADALGIEVGAQAPLAEVREAVLAQRRRRGMLLDEADHDTWSAGSFFTNPVLTPDQHAEFERRCAGERPAAWPEADGRVKISAAWLIEHAGFGRGYGAGPATLSTKHTLALTNRGGASTGDLLKLAAEVRDGVHARFGVTLVPEPVFAGPVAW
ncbi:UDP-N-acetylmuramate dehydrogenase [Actinospica durhamensis]|uniref:UDP-N-acetylenolpyruvoylglucosamine reductase n=1 Tax=Actinospica durhamensis TaxID=1508375 RepID=A0A941ESM8_9ACTN|nr:UDP-N-acetylmuramate dehydrogenase [Actinospica durhamensis]MBR7835743.1 UDP-N-acetylmuramate dehydrogenase [Actinospica durhamensis]